MGRLPYENIVYFGDTARVPYGPKSPQVVREYAAQDTDFLVSHDVNMVETHCKRALLLEGGQIMMEDTGANVASAYLTVSSHVAADGAFG